MEHTEDPLAASSTTNPHRPLPTLARNTLQRRNTSQTAASSTSTFMSTESDISSKSSGGSGAMPPAPTAPSVSQQHQRPIPRLVQNDSVPFDESMQSAASSESTTSEWGGSGGPLWRLAGQEASGQAPLMEQSAAQQPPNRSAWETFRQATRSQAEPHMVVVDPQDSEKSGSSAATLDAARSATPAPSTSSMVRVDKTDEAFLLNTGLAQKRVKVVQLLILGLAGLFVGWLGNFVVGTSCHFCSYEVQVGSNADLFRLHFGLYKYSPPDSALNGYSYCYPYTGSHASEAPWAARLTHLSALAAGTVSLAVLWVYLIFGNLMPAAWNWAIRFAIAASLGQVATTILFFTGTMCRTHSCRPGPATAVALATALCWALFAWRIHFFAQDAAADPTSKQAATELTRLSPTNTAEPTRTSKSTEYEPPSVVV